MSPKGDMRHSCHGRFGRWVGGAMFVWCAIGIGAPARAEITIGSARQEPRGRGPSSCRSASAFRPRSRSQRSPASVDDRTAGLGAIGGAIWAGTLDLSGKPPARKLLTVTARDVFGAQATATREFSLDNPPTLTIIAPQQDEVAAPNVRLTATCTDDGPAPVHRRSHSAPIAASSGARLEGSTSPPPMAAWDGQSFEATYIARDGSRTSGGRQAPDPRDRAWCGGRAAPAPSGKRGPRRGRLACLVRARRRGDSESGQRRRCSRSMTAASGGAQVGYLFTSRCPVHHLDAFTGRRAARCSNGGMGRCSISAG